MSLMLSMSMLCIYFPLEHYVHFDLNGDLDLNFIREKLTLKGVHPKHHFPQK